MTSFLEKALASRDRCNAASFVRVHNNFERYTSRCSSDRDLVGHELWTSSSNSLICPWFLNLLPSMSRQKSYCEQGPVKSAAEDAVRALEKLVSSGRRINPGCSLSERSRNRSDIKIDGQIPLQSSIVKLTLLSVAVQGAPNREHNMTD